MMPALGPTPPRPATAPPAGASPTPSRADAFALVLSGVVAETGADADAPAEAPNEAPATRPDDAVEAGGVGEGLALPVPLATAESAATGPLPTPPAAGGGGVAAPTSEEAAAVHPGGDGFTPPEAASPGGAGAPVGVSLGSETPQRSVSAVSEGDVAEPFPDVARAPENDPGLPTRAGDVDGAEPVRQEPVPQEPDRPTGPLPTRNSTPRTEAATLPPATAPLAPDAPRAASSERTEGAKAGRGGSVLDRPFRATTSPITTVPADRVETPPRPAIPSAPSSEAPSRPAPPAATVSAPPAVRPGGVGEPPPAASAGAVETALPARPPSDAPPLARPDAGRGEAAPRPAPPAAPPAATTPEGGAAVSTQTAPALRQAVVETTRTDRPPTQAAAVETPAAPETLDAEPTAPTRSAPTRAEETALPRPDRAPARPDAARSADPTPLGTRPVPTGEPDPDAPRPGGAGVDPASAAADPSPSADAQPAPTDVRTSAPEGPKEVGRPAPPARLAAPTWISRLATAERAQSVQVALGGGDGTVHLQTQREGEGVSVSLRFSDPELQALASAHVGRLRDALDAHFAEPVRLTLADGTGTGPDARGSGAQGGAGESAARDPSRPSPGGRARAADPPARLPRPPAADGRREWIG